MHIYEHQLSRTEPLFAKPSFSSREWGFAKPRWSSRKWRFDKPPPFEPRIGGLPNRARMSYYIAPSHRPYPTPTRIQKQWTSGTRKPPKNVEKPAFMPPLHPTFSKVGDARACRSGGTEAAPLRAILYNGVLSIRINVELILSAWICCTAGIKHDGYCYVRVADLRIHHQSD